MPVKLPERARAAAKRWMERGYKMLFYQDEGTEPFTQECTIVAPYKGYWASMNQLARLAAKLRDQYMMDACVFAGDDMNPDPSKSASQICRQFLQRFPDGFGVMQPCGDPQGMDASGKPAAARICGSAWFGRGWIERGYGGIGPTWPNYYHFYADEELAIVAEQQGVMWWRPDLTQFHAHWSWGHTPRQDYHKLTSDKHWQSDKALFEARRAAKWPVSQPAEVKA